MNLFSLIFILLATYCYAQLNDDKIQKLKPYKFGYEIQDENGNLQHRHEQSDGQAQTGSYGYVDANGIFRKVYYVADKDGFRAKLDSNEPGMSTMTSPSINIKDKLNKSKSFENLNKTNVSKNLSLDESMTKESIFQGDLLENKKPCYNYKDESANKIIPSETDQWINNQVNQINSEKPILDEHSVKIQIPNAKIDLKHNKSIESDIPFQISANSQSFSTYPIHYKTSYKQLNRPKYDQQPSLTNKYQKLSNSYDLPIQTSTTNPITNYYLNGYSKIERPISKQMVQSDALFVQDRPLNNYINEPEPTTYHQQDFKAYPAYEYNFNMANKPANLESNHFNNLNSNKYVSLKTPKEKSISNELQNNLMPKYAPPLPTPTSGYHSEYNLDQNDPSDNGEKAYILKPKYFNGISPILTEHRQKFDPYTTNIQSPSKNIHHISGAYDNNLNLNKVFKLKRPNVALINSGLISVSDSDALNGYSTNKNLLNNKYHLNNYPKRELEYERYKQVVRSRLPSQNLAYQRFEKMNDISPAYVYNMSEPNISYQPRYKPYKEERKIISDIHYPHELLNYTYPKHNAIEEQPIFYSRYNKPRTIDNYSNKPYLNSQSPYSVDKNIANELEDPDLYNPEGAVRLNIKMQLAKLKNRVYLKPAYLRNRLSTIDYARHSSNRNNEFLSPVRPGLIGVSLPNKTKDSNELSIYSNDNYKTNYNNNLNEAKPLHYLASSTNPTINNFKYGLKKLLPQMSKNKETPYGGINLALASQTSEKIVLNGHSKEFKDSNSRTHSLILDQDLNKYKKSKLKTVEKKKMDDQVNSTSQPFYTANYLHSLPSNSYLIYPLFKNKTNYDIQVQNKTSYIPKEEENEEYNNLMRKDKLESDQTNKKQDLYSTNDNVIQLASEKQIIKMFPLGRVALTFKNHSDISLRNIKNTNNKNIKKIIYLEFFIYNKYH